MIESNSKNNKVNNLEVKNKINDNNLTDLFKKFGNNYATIASLTGRTVKDIDLQ